MQDLDSTQDVFESPHYLLSDVFFYYLTNLETLDGNFFKLYRGGSLQQDQNLLIIKNNKDLKLNYKIIDGVVVAKDYATLAMLSAYYQFDFISSNLKKISNIDMQDIVNKYGKIEIFFEPKLSQDEGGLVLTQFPKENAAYLPYFHKFILFSRSKLENVPLSMNLQVIAHEFGHSIWEFTLNHGESLVCDRLGVEYAINGLNEGFADFFSYTLTGSSNILYSSLNNVLLSDMRNFSIISFDYDQINDPLSFVHKICEQNYYCLGTLFANALFQTQKILGYDQRLLFGNKSRSEFLKKIIFALMNTRENTIKYLPPLPHNFDSCSNTTLMNPEYDQLVLRTFFSSFLNQLSDKEIKYVLSYLLVENFGISVL